MEVLPRRKHKRLIYFLSAAIAISLLIKFVPVPDKIVPVFGVSVGLAFLYVIFSLIPRDWKNVSYSYLQSKKFRMSEREYHEYLLDLKWYIDMRKSATQKPEELKDFESKLKVINDEIGKIGKP